MRKVDVPIAVLMGNRSSEKRTIKMTRPPPAPNIPVASPIRKPQITMPIGIKRGRVKRSGKVIKLCG